MNPELLTCIVFNGRGYYHYAYRTEQTYEPFPSVIISYGNYFSASLQGRNWIKRYLKFYDCKTHPRRDGGARSLHPFSFPNRNHFSSAVILLSEKLYIAALSGIRKLYVVSLGCLL
jgi:hypothetical protein